MCLNDELVLKCSQLVNIDKYKNTILVSRAYQKPRCKSLLRCVWKTNDNMSKKKYVKENLQTLVTMTQGKGISYASHDVTVDRAREAIVE